jgi:hypothetical protein
LKAAQLLTDGGESIAQRRKVCAESAFDRPSPLARLLRWITAFVEYAPQLRLHYPNRRALEFRAV